jgi:hypothetical protein
MGRERNSINELTNFPPHKFKIQINRAHNEITRINFHQQYQIKIWEKKTQRYIKNKIKKLQDRYTNKKWSQVPFLFLFLFF